MLIIFSRTCWSSVFLLWRNVCLGLLPVFLFSSLILIYLAALGLSCGRQDLPSLFWHEGSFSCGMNAWLQHVGSSSLTRDRTQVPWIGSTACNWTREVSSFPFFSWVVCFFCYCVSCLDILEIKPFFVALFANICSISIGYFVLCFPYGFLCYAKACEFD